MKRKSKYRLLTPAIIVMDAGTTLNIYMKTKDKIKSEKSLIDQLREIRDNVSLDIKDMNSEQLKDYLNKKETLHPKAIWQNSK